MSHKSLAIMWLGVVALIIAFDGDPDLIDAIIGYLVKATEVMQ